MKKVLLTAGFFSLLNIIPHYSCASSDPAAEGRKTTSRLVTSIDESDPKFQATLGLAMQFKATDGRTSDEFRDFCIKWVNDVLRFGGELFDPAKKIRPKTYIDNQDALLDRLRSAHDHTMSPKAAASGASTPLTSTKTFADKVVKFNGYRELRDSSTHNIREFTAAEAFTTGAIEDAEKNLVEKRAAVTRAEALVCLAKASQSLPTGLTIDGHLAELRKEIRELTSLGMARSKDQSKTLSQHTTELQQYEAWFQASNISVFSGNEIHADLAETRFARAQGDLVESEKALKGKKQEEEARLTNLRLHEVNLTKSLDRLRELAGRIRHDASKIVIEIAKLQAKAPSERINTKIQAYRDDLRVANRSLLEAGLPWEGETLEKKFSLMSPKKGKIESTGSLTADEVKVIMAHIS
jgi:hypothetical protein